MVTKLRGKVLIPNVQGGVSRLAANTSGLVKRERRTPGLFVDRFHFQSATIAVAAADDFGSIKVCDLPNSNIIVVGVIVDVVAGLTSFTGAGSTLDVAIGLAATASTAFDGTDEKTLVPKIDATGAAAVGTVKGASSTTEKLAFIAAGASNAIFLNAACACTVAGTLTLIGSIDVVWIDLGKAA